MPDFGKIDFAEADVLTEVRTRQTKLGVFCDKVIEAGWLAAAIVLPLFFNSFSNNVFEPDKVTMLRSIALTMVTAWIIKVVEVGSRRVGSMTESEGEERGPLSFLRIPLVVPTLLLTGIYILSTITSVIPHVSLWGSYSRLQGAYTTLSYTAIFFLTLHSLRTPEQLERLITVVLLTSLPISLYGIVQHFKLDPLTWAGDISGRVISTAGNPIFLAAYLIMVVPLTLNRLIEFLSAVLTTGNKIASSFISMGCYVFLLAVQLICIIFTQSRGPLMGVMGGLFFFFFLLAISRGKKGLALTVIGLAMGLIVFLVILNLPNTPLATVRGMPYIGRLGLGVEKGRILIWEGAVSMIKADPVRAVVGYGPESMYVAFQPYLLPELADMAGPWRTADRSHNETFDILITTGFTGFSAYLLLFGSVFYYGLKWLGLITNSRQRALFVALWLVGASLGVLIPWLVDGTLRFAGVGIPAGIVVGLASYLVISLFFHQKGEAKDSHSQILPIALLSAIVAHFIEIQFGIAIATTRTYFWLCVALMVVVALFLKEEPARVRAPAEVLPPERPSKRRKKRRRKKGQEPTNHGRAPATAGLWSVPLTSRSLLVGLILMTMGSVFITNQYPLSAKGFSVPALLLLTWLFGGLIVVGEVNRASASRRGEASRTPFLLVYSLLSLGLFFIFLVFHTANLPPRGDPANTIVVYYLHLFLTIAAIAAALMKGEVLPALLWRRANWWLYLSLMVGAVVVILITNLNIVRADIYCGQGVAYHKAEQWDRSIALFRQALRLAPDQDYYYYPLGWTYLSKAESDADRRPAWFVEAKKAWEQGREINPLNPDHVANLGHLYLNWEQLTADPLERAERLNKALDYYWQAIAMSPHIQGRNLEDAVARTHFLLADAYMAMGEFDQAAKAYTQAIEIDSQKALQMGLEAVDVSPDDYVGHRNLAVLYQQLGRTDEAIAEARKALKIWPEKERAELDALMAWLEAQDE